MYNINLLFYVQQQARAGVQKDNENVQRDKKGL